MSVTTAPVASGPRITPADLRQRLLRSATGSTGSTTSAVTPAAAHNSSTRSRRFWSAVTSRGPSDSNGTDRFIRKACARPVRTGAASGQLWTAARPTCGCGCRAVRRSSRPGRPGRPGRPADPADPQSKGVRAKGRPPVGGYRGPQGGSRFRGGWNRPAGPSDEGGCRWSCPPPYSPPHSLMQTATSEPYAQIRGAISRHGAVRLHRSATPPGEPSRTGRYTADVTHLRSSGRLLRPRQDNHRQVQHAGIQPAVLRGRADQPEVAYSAAVTRSSSISSVAPTTTRWSGCAPISPRRQRAGTCRRSRTSWPRPCTTSSTRSSTTRR